MTVPRLSGRAIEQLTDMTVVFQHAVIVETLSGGAQLFFFYMGVVVHAGGIEPDEERFLRFHRTVDEVEDGCHPFAPDLQARVAVPPAIIALLMARR